MRALLILLLATPALAETPPRPVVTEVVSADALASRSFTGTIVAAHQTALAFQTSGRVATLPLAVGDRVEKGQVLATLDQVTLSEDVAAAEAALTSARAAADLAATSFARVAELKARGTASDQAVEAATQARDSSAAGVAAAEANLRRAKDAEGFGTLTAPEAGIVLTLPVKPGTVVAAGTPVVTLAPGDGREAVLDLPADYLPLLGQGQAFTLRSRVTGAAPLTARLRLIEPVAESATKSRRIRVTLDEAPDLWRIGALVRAELATSEAPVITLPASAVFDKSVWVVTEARKAHATPVTLGAAIGNRVIVTDGLSPGQEVVIRGVHSLTEGQELGASE